MIEQFALDLEPAELRRRNLITAAEMPYRTGLLDRRGLPQEYDSGDYLNPMVADAQVVGGVGQGIGGILCEHLRYDGNGQPLTSTFADYLMPTSSMVPDASRSPEPE